MVENLLRFLRGPLDNKNSHWSGFTGPEAASTTYQQRLADGPFSVSFGASGGEESFTFPAVAWPIEYADRFLNGKSDCTKPKGQIRP